MCHEEITLDDVCKILSISSATARNWVRLGKLGIKENGMFDKDYIESLVAEIKTGQDDRLKNRRNKKHANGKSLYKGYIRNKNNQAVAADLLAKQKAFSEEEIRVIIACYSIQLFCKSTGKCLPLSDGHIATGNKEFDLLLRDLLDGIKLTNELLSWIDIVQGHELEYVPEEDTLGFLYASICDISSRKQRGMYYTPAETVSLLLDNLFRCIKIDDTATFYDPCCGTGNFLINLINRGIRADNVYGQDIDETSVMIARINLFMRDNTLTRAQLVSQITCGDTLKDTSGKKFSIVLGNPPWGYVYNKEETSYLLAACKTAKAKGMEAYDLFVEKGLSIIENNGCLAYVLPEAFLNVASHAIARRLLLQKVSFKFVSYLGDAFPDVQCPAIILCVQTDSKGGTKGCLVQDRDKEFTISSDRKIDENHFSFNMTDEEYLCISAIISLDNAGYLRNNARFALGIVTGNNKEYIKTDWEPGLEPILKGSNIFRYSIKEPDNYIYFDPDSFQQTAPKEMYRAKEKLLYRFICDVPVFAYDEKQMLALNSCNILIPEIPGLQIKYVLAVLNSSVAAFYTAKRFHSVKLLRSHIEQIPIPFVPDEVQAGIIKKVDCLMGSPENLNGLYSELDSDIMDLYCLPEEMKRTIRLWTKGRNLFIR